jgi:hypothetical protein
MCVVEQFGVTEVSENLTFRAVRFHETSVLPVIRSEPTRSAGLGATDPCYSCSLAGSKVLSFK